MLYSLSRFRHLKPNPPFELGGEYTRIGDLHFLKDAEGSVDLMGEPELFQDFQNGDWIIVSVIRHNELSAFVGGTRLEVRSRRAYEPKPKPHVSRFSAFVARVYDHFIERGFNAIRTPYLVKCPGLEPTLEPLSCELAYGRKRTKVFLPTSPEIHLKKAMTLGWTDIFEIKTCFRNGEFSSHHDVEFAMLEWYRGFADLKLIEQDLRDLLSALAADGWATENQIRIVNTDFATLFGEILGFDLTPQTGAQDLQRLCRDIDVHFSETDSFNDLFHRIVIDRIEPRLQALGPTIVRGFPPSQAALAKLDSFGWADRFEFYWRGLEIANAFNEVNEPDEQERRWQSESEERKRLGSSAVPSDPDLIRAMQKGMPPAGGIALGLERLYMACSKVQNIDELRLFSAADLFGG